MRDGLPTPDYVRSLPGALALSVVVSLDGQLCGPDGSSRSISGPEDLALLRILRTAADTVVVGAATAEREGYTQIRVRPEYASFRVRHGLPEHPRLVVLHRRDDFAALLPSLGTHVLLEAGVRLHVALAPAIGRVWISHSPTLVGDAHATFSLDLAGFALASRHLGDRFVVSRFERLPA